MDGLIGGVVLAVVSGLTFVAYRHHENYKVVSWIAAGFAFIVIGGGRVYLEGFEDGMRLAADPASLDRATQSVRVYQLTAMAVLIYAVALEWLPIVLRLKKKDGVDDK